MSELTFIDMFAGIGGFRSGLEKAGHKCVGYIEWDKFARQSYQAIYDTKGEFTANDIQDVEGKELPTADIWTFGSPCTNISIAGNRKGLKGEQSRMFFEVIRLLKERIANKQALPTYLIMENVKNLLSSNGGRDFAKVIIEMDEVGYSVEWNVFDSAEVVPQHRERIYIVGHLRGQRTRQVFPIQRKSRNIVKPEIKRVYDARKHGDYSTKDVYSPEGVAPTLNTMQGGARQPKIVVVGNTSKTSFGSHDVVSTKGISKTIDASSYKHTPQVALLGKYKRNSLGKRIRKEYETGKAKVRRKDIRDLVFEPSKTSNTLTTVQKDNLLAVKAVITPDRVNKRQNGRRFKENEEPAFTLTAEDRHGVLLESGDVMAIRKLTPLECWRLQGFTDEQFNKAKAAGVSNSQLYKQAGNAVTVPVVEAIGEKL